MEERLRGLIIKIEKSELRHEEKLELYAILSEGLHAAVLPVLVKHLPHEKIDAFIQHPKTITVKTYVLLIEEALKKKEAMHDLSQTLYKLLDEIERLMLVEHIGMST